VSEHVDFATLHAVATAHPHASVVFVGPIARDMGDQSGWYARCRSLPNVHFVGPRPYERVGRYVPAFDVCLALYRPERQFTRLANPSKIRDYLASSRPIVSTALPDVERCWSAMIRVARSRAEYIEHVSDLLAGRDDTVELRLHFARAHTWEHAADLAWRSLTDAAARRQATHASMVRAEA
jgi:hypothetical protein